MSLTLTLIESLRSLGMAEADILKVVVDVERAADAEAQCAYEVPRSAGAIRQQRYRESRKASRVTSPVTSQASHDAYISPSLENEDKKEEIESAKPKRNVTRGVTLPVDWKLSEAERKYARERGYAESELPDLEADIIAWARSNEHRPQGKKTNWGLFVLAWIRRSAKEKKRFEKPSVVVSETPLPDHLIHIKRDSPEWPRYAAAWRQQKGKDPPVDKQNGWAFHRFREAAE